jgi:DNA-binding MarR family transcriptional regulator
MTYLDSTRSIDRDTFENTSEDELADLSVPDQVLGFLAANDDRAFKAREIASLIGVDEGAVSTALSRLKNRGLVETHGDVLGGD